MKKILLTILLLLSIAAITNAQNFKNRRDIIMYGGTGNLYAGDYDGSTEYLYVNNPDSMDLNGADVITLDIDNDFELVEVFADTVDNLDNWLEGSTSHFYYDSDWNSVGELTSVLDSAIATGVNVFSSRSLEQTLDATKSYIISFRYYVPSANDSTDGIRLRMIGGSHPYYSAFTITDAWTTATQIITGQAFTHARFYFYQSSDITQDAGVGDKIYVKNVSVDEYPNWLATGNHSFDSTSVNALTGSYSGVIVSALGSEIITGFTNGTTKPFNTLTTSNDTISSAIETTEDGGGAFGDVTAVVIGEIYQVTWDDYTLNSGNAPQIAILQNNAGVTTARSNVIEMAGGSGQLLTVTTTDATAYLTIYVSTGASNFSINNLNLQKYNGDVTSNYAYLPAADLTAFEHGTTVTVQWQGQSTDSGNVTAYYGGDSLETWTVNDDASAYYVVNVTVDTSLSGADAKLIVFVDQPDTIYFDEVDLSEAYDMSYSFWVLVDDITTANKSLWDRLDAGISTGDYFKFRSTYNGVSFDLYSNGTKYNTQPSSDQTSVLEDATWDLITFTADRTGNGTIYIDGVSKGTSDISGAGVIRNSETLYLAGYNGSATIQMLLGETQIIRGQILTADEILAAYNLGIKGKHFLETGNEVGWWWFAGNNDTDFLKDETGNNSLTGTNMTQADDQIKLNKYAD